MFKIIGKFNENPNGYEYESLKTLIEENKLIGDLGADIGSVLLLYPSETNPDGSIKVVAVDSENYYGYNRKKEDCELDISSDNKNLKNILKNAIDLLMETNNYSSKEELFNEIGLSCNEFKNNDMRTIDNSFAIEDILSYIHSNIKINFFNFTKKDIEKNKFIIEFRNVQNEKKYTSAINIVRISTVDMTYREFNKTVNIFHENGWSYTNRQIGAYENSFTMIFNNSTASNTLPEYILNHELNMDLLNVERTHHMPEGHITFNY